MRSVRWLALALVLAVSALPVNAQDNPPPSPLAEELTPAERKEVLGRLSDEQVRSLVLDMLERQAARAPDASEEAISGLLGDIERTRAFVFHTLAAAPRLYTVVPFFFDALIPDDRGAMFIVWLILGSALIVAVGFAAEWFYHRVVRDIRERLIGVQPLDFTDRLVVSAKLLGFRIGGVIVFTAAAVIALTLINPRAEMVRLAVLTYIFSAAAFRIVVAFSDFLLSPGEPSRRLVPLAGADALYIHRWNRWFAGLATFGFSTIRLLFQFGLEKDVAQLAGHVLSMVFIVLLLYVTWRIREPVAEQIRAAGAGGGLAGWVCRMTAEIWHLVFSGAFLFIYGAVVLQDSAGVVSERRPGLMTLVILLTFPLIGGALNQIVVDRARRRHPPVLEAETPGTEAAGDEAEAEDGVPRSTRMDTPDRSEQTGYLARPLIILGLLVIALNLLSWLWGVDLFAIRQGIGGKVFDALVQIALAMIVAYILWLGISKAIDPYMPEEGSATGPADEGGGTGASRIMTLMPLIRKFALVTLIVMTVMLVLSSLGVDVGPLIAGAGVIGLAIGFGAQSLVADIISGLFFLMDDAFRKGEYIEVGSTRGTVERISIRSFQLRHHNGPIHTIPYGQINSITNYSRDWAIMKFEIRVPFETDVDKVRKIIKKVGQKMMEDPELKQYMLEPLKSQGVNRMDDSAFIVRCKFTTIPGQQFYVRRVAYTMIQRAFEENGIQFAPKRVIVEAVTPHQAVAGAAAAAEAGQQQQGSDDRG